MGRRGSRLHSEGRIAEFWYRKYCESKAMLEKNCKPHLMAEVSPRTFWSIVYFYGRDIPLALKTMCPDVNFQFLNERAKSVRESLDTSTTYERKG